MDATPARMGKGLFGYKAKDVQKLFADREAMLRLAQQQSQEVRARADQMQAELGRVQEEITGRDRAIEALREEVRQRDESVSALRGELAQAQTQTQGRMGELEAQTHQLQQQLQQQVQDQDAQARALQQQLHERDAESRALQQQLHEQAIARDSQQILMDELAPILRAAQESAQRIVERAEETGELKTREAEQMRAELSGAISQYVRWRQRLEGIMATVQDRLDDAQSRISEVPKRIQEALAPMSDAIYLFNEDLTTLSQVGEPPGQVAIPAAPQQAAEHPSTQASGDEHIVLPDASRQRPDEGLAGQPSPPAEQPTYVEPEGADPTIQPGEQPGDTGPRYIEDPGDAVEGDDSTGVWTRTGWS
jgi:predicted  nucleic acid-binding Zn-ribbon protein